MKAFVDANLLIYLNTVRSVAVRVLYENFYVDILEKYKAYTDVLVLDELLYVSWEKIPRALPAYPRLYRKLLNHISG